MCKFYALLASVLLLTSTLVANAQEDYVPAK